MVRPALPQPSATAHQPTLVALKTRLFSRAFIGIPGLLARLSLFHSYHFPALWPESGHQGSSDSFGAQVYYRFEMIFFNYRNV